MVKLLFDTTILIDYLNGVEQAAMELKRDADKAISLVTWLEVMGGVTPETEHVVKGFLGEFTHLPLDESVAVLALRLGRLHGITRSNAIIWATAQVNSRILVTRNTNNFPAAEPGVRIPYEL